jgi:hypothetical protein
MTNWNWPELIKEQKESGKTIADFSKEKGFHYTSFYHNRKKLNKRDFVEVKIKKQLSVTEHPLTLKYNGFSLKVHSGFNRQTLKDILTVLEDL